MRTRIVSMSLTVVLFAVIICGCASLGKGPSDEDLIAGTLADWKAAVEAQDIDKMMAVYSEDFEGEGGAGKPEAREFIEGAKEQGYLDDAEVYLEDAETVIEADTATVAPIGLEGAFGSVDLELYLTKEADGVWRVTESGQY